MLDVCLVSMPYASIERPSLGLSLLQASLEGTGIRSRVLYPNLKFAERIGIDVYTAVEATSPDELIGEWSFSGAAFPDHSPDHAVFLQRAIQKSSFLAQYLRLTGDPRDLFWQVRRAAEEFVQETAADILHLKPSIVGCTSSFQQHCASLALLREIRKQAPEIVTMMGGANCEAEMGRTSAHAFEWVDLVVSGEAEALFPELCRLALKYGAGIPPEKLPAAVFSRANKTDRPSSARLKLDSMAETPLPRFEDYFQALGDFELQSAVHPALLIETSRGCWWGQKHHCTFCGLNGGAMSYRVKPARQTLEEFSRLSARYGVRRFEMVDNILDMSYIESVLPELARREEPLTIFSETKANLRRDQMEKLAAAGICWIQPGLESMHREVLRLIDKGNTAMTNVQLLKWARELGIRVSWNLLCEAPGEEDAWYDEMANWFPLISHLQPPSGVLPIRIDRFSPYHQRPQEFGLELSPNSRYGMVYPLPEQALNGLAYFFERTGETVPGRAPDGRPGLQKMRHQVREWQLLWQRHYWPELQGPKPADLTRTVDAGILIVKDSRPIALQPVQELAGLSRLVYELCDPARSESSVIRMAAGSGLEPASEGEIKEILQDLVDRRLLLQLEDRYLALATCEPRRPLPREWEFPGGYVENSYFLGLLKRANLSHLARSLEHEDRPPPLDRE